MNPGTIEKAARETWPLTLILGGALFIAEALLAYGIATFQSEIADTWSQIEFLQKLMKALLGTNGNETFGPHVFRALPWVHPIPLAMIWALELTVGSRLPAGEIDRGTIDVLLGLPVSRLQVYLSETLVFLLAGVVVFALGATGNYLGCTLSRVEFFPSTRQLVLILTNGFCLYIAVGGLVYFFSALSDRRGQAVGWGLAVVLASFLLSFLAQFWELAKSLSFLSLLTYFRPAAILRAGEIPWSDALILLALGTSFWAAAGWIFGQRDIRTV